jgi:signal transduction histidine kinase
MMSLRTFLRLGVTLVLAFGAAYVTAAEFREAANALRQRATLAAFQANRNVHLTLESARAHLDLVADNVEVVAGKLKPDAATDRAIDRAMARNTAIRGVMVQDANGTVVAAGEPRLGIGLSFGEYDFFKALRADASLVYSFGAPFRSRILQTTVVPFARAMRDADGEFAGAVAIGVPLEAFRTALAADAAASGIRAFLFRNDGRLLAADDGRTGEDALDVRDIWGPRRLQGAANFGTADLAEDPAGAPARIVAWHANSSFPLTVVATAAHDRFPPAIRLTVGVAVLAFAALAGLIWTTAYLADREIRRVNAAAAEVAAARDAAQHARERAEQATHAKTLLLARFSHEFRTPLNAVIGFADLTRLGYSGAIPERARENLAIIHRAGDHLHRMIGTLLDLSRLELDDAALAKEACDLKQILREAVDMATADAAAKSVEIELHMPTEPCRLDCDRSRLLQVLVNLLSNAVRNGPHRSVVAATLHMNEAGAGFRVLDQGPGIAPERLATIFEPFGGTHPDAVRPTGVGLGLAISAQIMAAHGGSLTLENRRGGGLCATAILPGDPARAAA